MGYPYQYVFGFPIDEENYDLRDLSNLKFLYWYKEYIEPFHPDYKNPFDYTLAKEECIKKSHEFDDFLTELNNSENRIIKFLSKSHPIEFLSGSLINSDSLDYSKIKDKIVLFGLDSRFNIYSWDKRQLIISNKDLNEISSVFQGMFNISEVKHGLDHINVPFKIYPPYISFQFS